MQRCLCWRTSASGKAERAVDESARAQAAYALQASAKAECAGVIDAVRHHLIPPFPFSRNAFVEQRRTYQDLLRGCMFSLFLDCLFDDLFDGLLNDVLVLLIGYSI